VIPAAFAEHALLLQEPWGLLPHEVAAMDVWQVRELYLKPAIERGRRMKGEQAQDTGETLATFADSVRAIRPNATDAEVRAMWDRVQAGGQ
jgi:hypothetical protein